MKSRTRARKFLQGLFVVLLTGFAPSLYAIEYWLRADVFTIGMPSGNSPPLASDVPIQMWGFAPATAAGPGTQPVTVPGPSLTVPANDTTLTIHLYNRLPEPVSIVIPGQAASMTPVKFSDTQNRMRVRSFTHETQTANSVVVNYTWTNLRPGTFLYHSGTHPAVQVQMGLYGSVKKNALDAIAQGAAQVYPGKAYDREVTLLYSEIDPALHAAVASGIYGTPAYPSTIDYAPKYFLINGKPYTNQPPLVAGNPGHRILLRFLNAGLQTHVPVIQGLYLKLIAEDGNPYSYAKELYSVFLPAAKTTDAIMTSTTNATYALYDRRLSLTNGAVSGGGMFASLNVSGAAIVPVSAAVNKRPIASNDIVITGKNKPITINVLANDRDTDGLLSPETIRVILKPNTGTVLVNTDGTISYTPKLNFIGEKSFAYTVNDDLGAISNRAKVKVKIR